MLRVAKAIFLVVSGWFVAMTVVGFILAETIGQGEHGSAGFVVLGWYIATVGVFTHLLILLLRKMQGRYSGSGLAE